MGEALTIEVRQGHDYAIVTAAGEIDKRISRGGLNMSQRRLPRAYDGFSCRRTG